jgi:hypothetical protein
VYVSASIFTTLVINIVSIVGRDLKCVLADASDV